MMYDLISKIENITSFTQQLICFATASNLSSECLVRHTSVKNGFAHIHFGMRKGEDMINVPQELYIKCYPLILCNRNDQ